MAAALLVHRRIAGTGLAAALGQWRRPGPAYAALADAMRRAVLAGDLPLATRVPGERELAAALGVSRTTTSGAYGVLRDEGYLVSRQGSGTVTALPAGAAARPALPVHRPLAADGVVDLTIAACAAPRDLHGAAARALEALPAHAGHGYAPLGLDVLRQAVADRYTARGTPTSPDQVLITTGAQHAIALLLGAHAGPGDRVVVEQPTYPHAIEAVRATGARPVPVPTGPGGTDLDLLESTVRQVAPRLVYLIPDHHNPTGATLDAAGRARVRDLARRTGTVVVGDEALTDLTLDGPEPAPWAGDGRNPRVVAIGSMSKSHWGGLRVGWLRGPADLVTRLALARRTADLGTAVLDQLVAAELLALGARPVAERRAWLREGRDLLAGLLAEALPEWRFTVPAGGQSLWVDLGAPVSSALSALALAHGVRVAPGPAFGVDGGLEDRLRVPYTSDPADLRRAVDGLALAWSALGRGAGAGAGAGAGLALAAPGALV
ncbi:PLP-dependent aminotransferase family protein [Cellulomonas hominis]|jgi:DNA-binding transcriptional MocR family regulator|uniref:MocR-like transcription factor YczR n=1 Tax=Cellulomonas hominis TaxID=156981 RepID=UPI001C10EA41|nr:PLP-dependent aminotransferase family protein [Cellulomonas hominis]MBU5423094.1 PLP-dependent aminotransferase family protein [Cellulomonas hominis]